MRNNSATIVVQAEDKVSDTLDKIAKNTSNVDKAIAKSIAKIGTLTLSVKTLYDYFSTGVAVNIQTEQATKSIAGLVSSMYEIKDASGNLLSGMEKYNKSLVMAEALQGKLLKKSIETASSYQSLREAFQAGLAPGAANNFTADQVMEISSIVDGARKMFGLEQNQLTSELRAILSNSITNNSTIGTALGLRGDEAYKEALKVGKGYEYLIEKLKYLKVAAEDSAESVGGMFDTLGDLRSKFVADSTAGFLAPFKDLRGVLDGLIDKNGDWVDSFKPVIAMFNNLSEMIGSALMGGISAITSLIHSIGELYNSNTTLTSSFNFLFNTINTTVIQLKDAFTSLSESINLEVILSGLSTGLAVIISAVRTAIVFVVERFEFLFDVLKNAWLNIKEVFYNVQMQLYDLAETINKVLPESFKIDIDTSSLKAKIKEVRQEIEELNKSRANASPFEKTRRSIDGMFNDIQDAGESGSSKLLKQEEEKKRIKLKKEEEVKEFKLTIQKKIDDATLSMVNKTASNYANIWMRNLNNLKSWADFQLSTGQISSAEHLSKTISVNNLGAEVRLKELKDQQAKELEALAKQRKEFETKNNFNNLDKEGQDKYVQMLGVFDKQRAEAEKRFQTQVKSIRSEALLENSKATYAFEQKQQKMRLDNLRTGLNKERDEIEYNLKAIELDKQAKNISELEYHNKRIALIQQASKIEQQEIKETIKTLGNKEEDQIQRKELMNKLAKIQKNELLEIKEAEADRIRSANETAKAYQNLNAEMREVLNSFNRDSLEFEKRIGKVNQSDYFDKKKELLKEQYAIQMEMAKAEEDGKVRLFELEHRQSLELQQLEEERRQSLLDYENKVLDIQQKLYQETNGFSSNQIDKQIRQNKDGEELRGFDEKDRDLVKRYQDVKNLTIDIKNIEEEFNALLKNKEEAMTKIANLYDSEKIGMSDLFQMSETFNLKELEYKDALIERLEKIREMQELTPEQTGYLDAIQARISGMDEALEQSKELMDGIRESMSDNLADILTGTKTIKDGFRDMLSSITKMLMDFVAKQFVRKMLDGIGMGQGGAISNGLTGLFSSFAMSTRASGGQVKAGQPLIIGETGRELFIPQTNGTILNHSQTQNAITNNNTPTVINNYNIRGRKGDRFEDSTLNNAVELGQLLEQGKRNT